MSDKEYRGIDPDLEDIIGIVLAGPAYEVWVLGYSGATYLGDEFKGECKDKDNAILMAQLIEKDPRKYSEMATNACVDSIEIIVEKVYDIENNGETVSTNVNTIYSKVVEVV
jgi:hypothetical protein